MKDVRLDTILSAAASADGKWLGITGQGPGGEQTVAFPAFALTQMMTLVLTAAAEAHKKRDQVGEASLKLGTFELREHADGKVFLRLGFVPGAPFLNFELAPEQARQFAAAASGLGRKSASLNT